MMFLVYANSIPVSWTTALSAHRAHSFHQSELIIFIILLGKKIKIGIHQSLKQISQKTEIYSWDLEMYMYHHCNTGYILNDLL